LFLNQKKQWDFSGLISFLFILLSHHRLTQIHTDFTSSKEKTSV